MNHLIWSKQKQDIKTVCLFHVTYCAVICHCLSRYICQRGCDNQLTVADKKDLTYTITYDFLFANENCCNWTKIPQLYLEMRRYQDISFIKLVAIHFKRHIYYIVNVYDTIFIVTLYLYIFSLFKMICCRDLSNEWLSQCIFNTLQLMRLSFTEGPFPIQKCH